MTTIRARLDALGLEAKKTRQAELCYRIVASDLMEGQCPGECPHKPPENCACNQVPSEFVVPAISELLTELEVQAKMLRLAILDGEHPAGMDADYLAELRDRATAKTEEGSDG